MSWKKKCAAFAMSVISFSSAAISGGLESFFEPTTCYAEDTDENILGDGTYIVPVQTINWNTGNVLNTSKSVPYAPRCILNVDGNENTITLKIKADVVAAWYLDNNFNAQFPKIRNLWKSFGTDIRDSFDKLATDNKGSYGASKYTFDEANNGNYNPINIEKNNSDDTWCYVTFSVSDYSEKICTVFWMENLALGDSNDVMQNMKLDIDNAFLVSELNEKIANGKAGVTFEEARSITNKSGHSLAESQELKSIFSGIASVEKTDDVYVTSIDLNTNQLSGSDIVEVNAFTSRSYVADSIYNNFIPFNTIYGDKLLQDGKYLDATFNEDSLIYGLDITVETEAVQIEKAESSTGDYDGYFGTLCLNPYDVVDVTINDTNQTGVYVTGLSNVLPESSVLKVVKDRSADEYPDSLNFTRRSITEWSGDMYNDPKHWFYIELTDAEGNDLANYDGITLHIPVENPDNYDVSGFVVFGYREADSLLYSSDEYGYEKYGSIKEITDSSGNKTYEFQYTNSLGQLNIQNSTFGYMRQGEYDDLHSKVVSGDDDGIYTATGMLQKFGTRGTSMANAAVDPNVMFTINNGEIKFYFVSDYMNVMFNEAYIGELLSYDVSHDGVWFDDSVSYTNFDIDENGNLTSNFGYDPITEAANVKGGIITLREETYDTVHGCYDLAVVSPAMLALSGTSYADLQKDQLTVHLRTTDLTKVADYSEENVQKYIMEKGYGYHPSALLRRIKQVENKFASNKGEAKLEAALAEANKVYTAKYEDAAAASKAYEAAIAKLDEFEAGYDMTKNLPDGKYIVHADMVQLNRVDASMSDAAINHDIVVNVKDGKATVQVEFKGLAFSGKFGYLSRLWNYDKGYTYSLSGAPIGTKTEAKVLSKYDVIDQYSNDNPPHYLEFELVDGVCSEWVPLHVYVPVMTGSEDQDVNMHIDWSTARKAGDIAEYTGNTLSLKDDFGLNFFFNFGEQTLNDAGAKVKFTLPDGSVKEYVISEIADADKTANGYKFSANVAAKEMTAPVKVQVILSNGETSEVFSCSVKEYADKLLASSTNESEIALVKSILNYGGYAQEFFGYNKTALANADLTDAEKTLGDVTIANTKRERVEDEDDGINFYGSSLSLNTKIDLKAYFTLEDGAKISDYTFKIGSTELTPVESGNKYYVTIPDITSRDIDERSAIEIANKSGEGELSVKTGPYAYIYKALSKSSDEKLQSLMKALYFYSQAAEKYNA